MKITNNTVANRSSGSSSGRGAIISFGQTTESKWCLNNTAELETADVDGRVIEIRYPDSATGPNKIETTVFDQTATPITDADLAQAKADLVNTNWTKYKHLVVNIDVRPAANFDWNNPAHITKVKNDFKTIAKFLKEVEQALTSKGIKTALMFDTEPYLAGSIPTADLFRYTAIYNPTAIAYEAYRDVVRQAGRDIATAVWTEFPSLPIITSIGYHYAEFISNPGTAWNLKKYSLLPDLLDGFCDKLTDFPLAYISEFLEGEYVEYTFDGFNYYVQIPTGYKACSRTRSANFNLFSFDCSILPYLKSSTKTASSTTNGTVLSAPGNQFLAPDVNNSHKELWMPLAGDYNGVGTTRQMQSFTSSTVTVDQPVSIDAGSMISSRSPARFYDQVYFGTRFCSRYLILYQNGDFSFHRATGSVIKMPSAYYRALSSAKKGGQFLG